MQTPTFEHITSLQLLHQGDTCLLGVADDQTIYLEEIYGDEGWMAQLAVKLDGTVVSVVDEDNGKNSDVSPLDLPDTITRSESVWNTMGLNFSGARHRGMRGAERIDEVVRPLHLQEKMALIDKLNLDIPPPMIIGLSESYVLAEAELVHPNLFLVCRRVRLAYALPKEATDENNEPYDYDSKVLFVAQIVDKHNLHDSTVDDGLTGLGGVALNRPMDCLVHDNYAFVADGGSDTQPAAVHIWKIHRPPQPEKPGVHG